MNEQSQRDISKGVYRGQWMSKNGWDPGDPDDYPIWQIAVIFGIFLFLVIANIFS